MSKHTPTPWVKDHGGTWGHIKSIGDCGACGKNNVKRTPTVARYDMNELVIPLEEQEANARHIVHCVNNYGRLIEALEEMLSEFNENMAGVVHDEMAVIAKARSVLRGAKYGTLAKDRTLLAQLGTKGDE